LAKASADATISRAGSKRRLRLWLAFIVVFMTWALYTVANQLQEQKATELRYAAVVQQKAEAEKLSAELSRKIERLQDPEYIQEVARRDQGMIMPGEQPIQTTDTGE